MAGHPCAHAVGADGHGEPANDNTDRAGIRLSHFWPQDQHGVATTIRASIFFT